MLRRILVTLTAAAFLSAAGGATNPARAFPFGPPPGPPPGLGGFHPGFAGPPPGLAGPHPGLAAPPRGLVSPPRAAFGGPPARAGLGASAAHSAPLSRLGNGAVRTRYGQSAHAGYSSGHNGWRYGRWVRDGLYGSATSGYGYGSDGYSSSSSGCAYVYGYSGGEYRRTTVCSEN